MRQMSSWRIQDQRACHQYLDEWIKKISINNKSTLYGGDIKKEKEKSLLKR